MHTKNMKPVGVEKLGNRTVYCGPTAIAALIDVPVHKVNNKLLAVRRKRHLDWSLRMFGKIQPCDRKKARKMYIKGTHASDLRVIVRHYRKKDDLCQIYLEGMSSSKFRTLEDWIILPSSEGGPTAGVGYLVCVMNHWVAVKNDEILDTHSAGAPVKYHKHKFANRKVKKIYAVLAKGE